MRLSMLLLTVVAAVASSTDLAAGFVMLPMNVPITHSYSAAIFAATPPADHFDMDELKKRIAADQRNPYYSGWFHGTAALKKKLEDVSQEPPVTVYIITFDPTENCNGGIHSIEYPVGSGNNVILAFESKEACDRFAVQLREQQFFDPSPQEVSLENLDDFCDTLGVYVQVVPDGIDLIPPTQMVKSLGHNPDLKEEQHRLNYLFAMAEEFEDEGLLIDAYESSFQ